MKLLLTALLSVCVSYSFAQTSSEIFVISAEESGSSDFSSFRKLNTEEGKVIKDFFNKQSPFNATLQQTGRKIDGHLRFSGADSFMHPMGNLTGALAYDAKNQRLFFAPVGLNQLRFLDLNASSVSFTYIDDQKFGEVRNNPGAQISRMVIAPNGYGYALSNDGDHFIQFTTENKIAITDLGALKDNPADTINGYHRNCTCLSYGGDMVADTKGDLYVITANNRVHKIDVRTKQISFIGTIKGLPEGFTTNGAAVNEEGKIVISSAVSTKERTFPFFKFDIKNLETNALNGNFFNASDLASANFIQVNEPKPVVVTAAQFQFKEEIISNKNVSVFPNPVRGSVIKVSLNNLTAGNYNMVLFDLQGKMNAQRKIQIVSKSQTEQMNAPAAQGQYMLMLVNAQGKIISNSKLVIAAD